MEYKYEIYQLNDSDEATAMRFMSIYHNVENGRIPRKDLYNLVYSGTGLFPDLNKQEDKQEVLEAIYCRFNSSELIPKNFRGHSLSVSDVVVLNGEPFYCNHTGFSPLTNLTEW